MWAQFVKLHYCDTSSLAMGKPSELEAKGSKKNPVSRHKSAPTPAAADPAAKKRPAAAIDHEESFPRGGASVLSHLERREVERQAKEEFDAEVLAGKVPKLGSSKKAKHNKVCLQSGVTRV